MKKSIVVIIAIVGSLILGSWYYLSQKEKFTNEILAFQIYAHYTPQEEILSEIDLSEITSEEWEVLLNDE
jgi:hypothetical protein